MPWKSENVMNKRIEFLIRAKSGESSLSSLCREFNISRPTAYLWLNRFEETGCYAGLAEKSRRPHHSPGKTCERYEREVVKLWNKHGWGARKTGDLLRGQGIELPESTINRIMKRNGLFKEKEKIRQATKRFEKDRPNEMIQMDFKGQYAIKGGFCFPLTMLDDHSRYLVSLQALPDTKGVNVQRCLIESFEENGVPESILVDHGTPWWSPSNSLGLTWVAVFLIKQGIKLRLSGIRHPQTQGKVERFHRTLNEGVKHHGRPSTLAEWAIFLSWFRDEYNHIRPHEALGMKVPASRYKPSEREYCAAPKEWEYPAGSLVMKANSQGCIDYRGRRYFVCEALAGELIRIEESEGRFVISYRHMLIREIDVETGRGKAFVKPRK